MEGKKPFFKIVIPNYNNYIYIKKCLDSVLEQTFKDYVCIVVDDLSTDDSPKIAQIYARRYPDRFKFIQLKEKGHEGGARNAGIDYPIDCEYYYFVDSDDYLHDKYCLQRIYDNVKSDMPDILLFKMIQLIDGKFVPINYEKFRWDSKTLTFSHGSASSKIVRNTIMERFLENCDHAADNYQWCRLLDKSPRIREIDDIIYVYRRNATSLTRNGKYEKDAKVYFDSMSELRKTLKNEYVIRSVDHRLDIYRRRMAQKEDPLERIIEKYGLREKTLGKQDCIIIGANNSIKDFMASDYINKTSKLVIRINRPAQRNMFQNYGTRCDLIIGTEYAKNLSDGFPNRINISDSDIKELSKKYVDITKKQLTTGFVAILLCMKLFKTVEIFGFGYGNVKEDETKYRSVHDNWDKTRHLINFEHQTIQKMIGGTRRLTRFEDMHDSLKLVNIILSSPTPPRH